MNAAAPRSGFAGFTDRLVGPGASAGEQAVSLGAAALGGAVAVAVPLAADAHWSGPQLVVVALLGLDLFGGAVANATDAAHRWWHRPGRTDRHHVAFVACHVHPFALPLLFQEVSWAGAAALYGAVLLSAVVTTAAPARLRRPVAFALGAVVIAGSVSWLALPAELTWFAPVLTVKLILAHLLPDRLPDPPH